MSAVSWRLAFLRARSLERPTGNPLCTYKCTDAEFEALRLALASSLDGEPEGATTIESACFVLFGAEWFRREHSGGHWTWDGIFQALAVSGPDNPQMRSKMVMEGLGYWKREVFYTGTNRAFLITLAAEGGLPLKLLREQGAHLRRFFRALLQDLEDAQGGGEVYAVSERAAEFLPASFCRPKLRTTSVSLSALMASIFRRPTLCYPQH